MFATLMAVLAQHSQEAPEEGVGIGLILLGVLIAAIIAVAIFTVFTKTSKRRRGMAPRREPHEPGHTGA